MRFWSSRLIVDDIRRLILTFLSHDAITQLLCFGDNDHEYQLEIIMDMPTGMHGTRIQRVLAECGNMTAMSLMSTPWVEDIEDWIGMLEYAKPNALLATIQHEISQQALMSEMLENLFSMGSAREIPLANAKIMCEKMPMTEENKMQYIYETTFNGNLNLLDFQLNELKWHGTLPNFPRLEGTAWEVLQPHIVSGRIKIPANFSCVQMEPSVFYCLVDCGQITKPQSPLTLSSCFDYYFNSGNFEVAEYYWNNAFSDTVRNVVHRTIEAYNISFACKLCDYAANKHTNDLRTLCNEFINVKTKQLNVEQTLALIRCSGVDGDSTLLRRMFDKTNISGTFVECLCESLQAPQTNLTRNWLHFVWEFAATLVANAALHIAIFAERNNKHKLLQFLEEHQLLPFEFHV